ncbi:hypothetical protein CEP52_014981 [Fusarium oligoseptatum]|uniref:Pisatin demethylase n=1 Tax=Fusarium oligoseptatum TaxID=2604345 RepID=A0A428SH79_9HYPO|nr:hypothetical protein CEP52_014981 [Fusarium oligoseptatum]
MKRPIGKYYSSSSVLSVEPLINRVALDLCGYLDERFVKANKPCDLGAYIAYCAWDMVGAATFSENYGYMEKGCDFDGTIEIADRSLDYFVAVGQMPFLDRWLDKNPFVRIGPPNLGSATKIALDHIAARATGNDLNPETPDFLDRFFEAKQQHPDTVHDGTILNYVFINLIAGADTTAITIRAVIYFVLKHREVHRKLVEEILGADFGEVAQYSTARSLPYLEACIRETTRVHPGVAMNLERYVPDSGLTLPNDKFVPAGTKVGINPYVVHRNPSVWGEDVDDFRPERWLQQAGESEDAFAERLKLFNNSDLTFGGGSRICLGRHLGMLEVYKIIGTLFARYEIELIDQDEEWSVTNSCFPSVIR